MINLETTPTRTKKSRFMMEVIEKSGIMLLKTLLFHNVMRAGFIGQNWLPYGFGVMKARF